MKRSKQHKSELTLQNRECDLTSSIVCVRSFSAQLTAGARSHRRFKPIEVLGQGTCERLRLARCVAMILLRPRKLRRWEGVQSY
jgi:hypothetical protein